MTVLVYLRLPMKKDAFPEFNKALKDMMELAQKQPGFISAEVFRLQDDETDFLVLSEWESKEQSNAFEHHATHEDVMDKYEDSYNRTWVKKRYVPL